MDTTWLTTKEAAELSGYHPEHIRRLLSAKQLKGRKFGEVWQVNKKSLLEYLSAAQQPTDKRRGPKV